MLCFRNKNGTQNTKTRMPLTDLYDYTWLCTTQKVPEALLTNLSSQ